MKIAIVSKLWEATGADSTGGTGLAVGLLVDELVKRGHQVTLFATGDSKTKAKLVSVRPKPWKNDYSEPIEYLNIAKAFSQSRNFDLIHCHVEQKACLFADLLKNTPHLLTLRYGQLFADEIKILKHYKHLNYSTNSQAMTKLLPFIKFKGVVYNGLDLSRYPFNNRPKDYLLFLGRLSPQKGPEVAIKVAKILNKKIILAGKIVAQDKNYTKRLMKMVDNKNVRYLGEVKFKQKINLLKNAFCLLHPNTVFESCSNTILESLACGTPVVCFDRGSNKELMINSQTGLVVKNMADMIKGVKKIKGIKRADCRRHIDNHFTVAKMATAYEKLYKNLT